MSPNRLKLQLIAVALLIVTGNWMASCAAVIPNRRGHEAQIPRTPAEVKAQLDAADKAFAEGNLAGAEKGYREAIATAKRIPRGKIPISGNPMLALSRLALGLFYLDQDKYHQAISLFQISLPDLGLFFGPKDGLVGTNLIGQAVVYLVRRDITKAEPLIYRAVPILHEAGPQHGTTRIIANVGLAIVLSGKSDLRRAESLVRSALGALERTDEPRHHRIAARLLSVATAFMREWGPEQAETLMKRTLMVVEQIRGPDDIGVAESIESYAAMLREANRLQEAAPLESRAKAIREKLVKRS